MEGTSKTAIIASIVALVLLAVLLILGLAIAGKLDAASTPLVVTVLGLIVATVPGLVAAIKSNTVQKAVGEVKDSVDEIQNGTLTTSMKRAIREEREDRNG